MKIISKFSYCISETNGNVKILSYIFIIYMIDHLTYHNDSENNYYLTIPRDEQLSRESKKFLATSYFTDNS